MKQNINEHDMTKKMMDIIRGGFNKKIIKEAEEELLPVEDGVETETTEVNDADFSLKQGDSRFDKVLKQLQDTVDPRIEITNFKVYISYDKKNNSLVDRNIVVEGTLLKQQAKDSGIKFRMELNNDSIQLTQSDVELSDDTNEALQKLRGYFENWVREWAKEFRDEFTQEINDIKQ